MIDAVIDRLKTEVPDLHNRVRGAAEFGALMQSRSLPTAPVFAYVLFGGLFPGGKPETATGIYRQQVRRNLSVALIVRSNDGAGAGALDQLETLTEGVLRALCGWAPGDEIGVFELARAALVSFTKGTAVFQIDLTIPDQLRIST